MKTLHSLSLLLLSPLLSLSQCEIDETDPWFSDFQEEVTISCDTDLSTVFPQAFDDCDTLVEIAYYDETFPGSCPNEMDIVRLYRAFDDSGNQKVELQTIHIIDEEPPLITGEIYLELQDASEVNSMHVTVTDNCSTYSIIYEDVEVSGGNIIRTYTAADECGNSSAFTQILYIPTMLLYVPEKTVTMCKCVGNDTWITIHVNPDDVQSLLGLGSYMGRCRIKDHQNQAIPLRMHIEIARDGSIRKFVK